MNKETADSRSVQSFTTRLGNFWYWPFSNKLVLEVYYIYIRLRLAIHERMGYPFGNSREIDRTS